MNKYTFIHRCLKCKHINKRTFCISENTELCSVCSEKTSVFIEKLSVECSCENCKKRKPCPLDNCSVCENNIKMWMNFSQALELLKKGHTLQRSGWNGKGLWIALYSPEPPHTSYNLTGLYVKNPDGSLIPFDTYRKMTLPYLYIKTADDQLVPWLASQTDILADDWQEFLIDS